MHATTHRRFMPAILAAVLIPATTGCELFDDLTQGSALVHVFATHHATPEDGVFPDLRRDDGYRSFENEDGWMITLTKAFAVTHAVTIEGCNGRAWTIDLHQGQFPEDLNEADLEISTLGGAELPSGDYCALLVEYAPYDQLDTRNVDRQHPDTPEVEGASLYLRGVAEKGGQIVPFELRSQSQLLVELDISTLEEDQPFQIAKREAFPRELTVSKTYDRFFDGVDFAAMDTQVMQEQALQVLLFETRVSEGTIVYAQ